MTTDRQELSTHSPGTESASAGRHAVIEDYSLTHRSALPMRRVSWGAIFAGAVIATAILFMLSLLGIGIGGYSLDPNGGTDALATAGIGAGVFGLIAQLVAVAVGAAAAGRLAAIPHKINAGLHGAAVWALATLGMLYLATTTAGSLLGGAVSAVNSATSYATASVEAVIPDDLSLPEIDINDLPPSVRNKLEARNLTLEEIREEARSAVRSVVSEQEQSAVVSAVQDTVGDIVANPGNATDRLDALVDRLFGGSDAVLSDEDRQQAMTELEESIGVSPEEAQVMLDKWQKRTQQAVSELQATVDEAQEQALVIAQAATDSLAKAGIAAFIASLVSLVVAYLAAMAGRTREPVMHTQSV